MADRSDLVWRDHGGRLAAAAARWPDAPAPWLDLSTGINPHAWPVAQAGPIDWRRLPDPEDLATLEAAAAAAFGVAADRVCATPGSEAALRLLGTLDWPPPVRVRVPGYRTHAEAFAQAGPVAAVDGLAGGTLLLADPANPQGDRLAARAGGVARLIVDAAYADAMATAAQPDARTVVLRSFGKFYGLAGVRLGFVLAAPEILAAVRARLGSWPVSAAAIAIGTAAYRDTAWQDAMRARLAGEAAALDAVLARHGLAATGDCPLFRLVRTPDANTLFARLARAGILTRPFAGEPGWLRLGLPGDALDRLDRALG